MRTKKELLLAAVAAASALAGCQTRITAEKFPEQVLPVQQKVTVNGEDRLVTTHYQVASGGWYATARSPLYAAEALEGLEIGVETNGTVRLALGSYGRDLSTNSVTMVGEMFSGGAQLVTVIGEAYVRIAGGGAQAETVLATASKVYGYFADRGGDASRATVTADGGRLVVSDGRTVVSCDADGNCSDVAK